jgi:hypothetical protein
MKNCVDSKYLQSRAKGNHQENVSTSSHTGKEELTNFIWLLQERMVRES